MKIYFFPLLLFLFSTACNTGGESICLIPKGYIGVVVIIFGQKDGAAPESEGFKQLYRIPASGILRTQVKASHTIAKHEYYYVDSHGKRIELPYKWPKGWEEVKELDSSGKVYCSNEEMGSTAINKPNYMEYRVFLVGDSKQVDSLTNIKNRVVFKEVMNFPY